MTLYLNLCPRCNGAVQPVEDGSEFACVTCGGRWYKNPGAPKKSEVKYCPGSHNLPLPDSVYNHFMTSGRTVHVALCNSCNGRVQLLDSGLSEQHIYRPPFKVNQ